MQRHSSAISVLWVLRYHGKSAVVTLCYEIIYLKAHWSPHCLSIPAWHLRQKKWQFLSLKTWCDLTVTEKRFQLLSSKYDTTDSKSKMLSITLYVQKQKNSKPWVFHKFLYTVNTKSSISVSLLKGQFIFLTWALLTVPQRSFQWVWQNWA